MRKQTIICERIEQEVNRRLLNIPQVCNCHGHPEWSPLSVFLLLWLVDPTDHFDRTVADGHICDSLASLTRISMSIYRILVTHTKGFCSDSSYHSILFTISMYATAILWNPFRSRSGYRRIIIFDAAHCVPCPFQNIKLLYDWKNRAT